MRPLFIFINDVSVRWLILNVVADFAHLPVARRTLPFLWYPTRFHLCKMVPYQENLMMPFYTTFECFSSLLKALFAPTHIIF